MDEAFIVRLEDSFDQLAPRGEELVERFYARLFELHPQVRTLFKSDLAEQRRKLLSSLALVVKSLRKPDQLQSALLELGKRHSGYGACPAHYGAVRDTLLSVMGEMAGAGWTAQLAADWKAALDFVGGVMQQGQAALVEAA